MNAITLLAQHAVEEALGYYDVGRLQRFWPSTQGIENSNYFVRTTQGDYVLTLLERAPFSGDGYFDILDTLARAGLPVPAPFLNRQHNPSVLIQGKTALLQPRLPGTHVTLPTSEQLQALGRLMGRMHVQTLALTPRIPGHPRNLEWLQRQASMLGGKLRYACATRLKSSVDTVASLLRREDVKALPFGVVHGDVFRDNVLFRDSALSGIIDFHHAASGTLLFDLAIAANDWCCDGTGQLNPEKAIALLRGYHSQRPLTRQELWFFSPFRLYAALAFWLSRLRVHLDVSVEGGGRSRNPHEMERIVLNLLRGFDYFDERMLDIG